VEGEQKEGSNSDSKVCYQSKWDDEKFKVRNDRSFSKSSRNKSNEERNIEKELFDSCLKVYFHNEKRNDHQPLPGTLNFNSPQRKNIEHNEPQSFNLLHSRQ
jgi:hypothetical protein